MSLFALLRYVLFCVALFLPIAAGASERVVIADFSLGLDAEGVPSGWQLKERVGKANFSIIRDGDLHALHLRSIDNSFGFQKPLEVDPLQYPMLSWIWKVTRVPVGGDFRRGETDDQAAQLFVAFSNRNAVVYIWDTTAPQGLADNAWAPPFMTIKAIVVRSGVMETGKWILETRNVCEDYKCLFGDEPPGIAGVRIQINSQHTETSGESFFADLVFQRQAERMNMAYGMRLPGEIPWD
ncbi:MAG: DUF3047 domain-containing protein [Proteobacteria bacterium]|nr:DUF3047 domain-containing protein [Pseudomonadota bacterium]